MSLYQGRLEDLNPGDGARVLLSGLNLPALARLVSRQMDGPLAGRRLLILAPTALEAEDLAGDLSFFLDSSRPTLLPAPESKPFLGQTAGQAPWADRLLALHDLAEAGRPAVVVASMAAALRLVPPPAEVLGRTLRLRRGQ
ncbi:MAG: hypothetical protein LBU12_09220, partial [Deltaproteobacteria bacterium]|nr:hypothetical protein [Deltaproteobacteria bacterium]